MTCIDVRDRLAELAVGGLCERHARAVREHLAGCAACREFAAVERLLADASARAPTFDVADGFAASVMDTWARERAPANDLGALYAAAFADVRRGLRVMWEQTRTRLAFAVDDVIAGLRATGIVFGIAYRATAASLRLAFEAATS